MTDGSDAGSPSAESDGERELTPAERKAKDLAGAEFDPTSVEPTVEDDGDVEPPDLADVDVDRETATLFWRLVFVFDVALLAIAVGPMLWYFDGRAELGLQVFALGVVVFTYGAYRLRTRDTAESAATE